MKKTVNHFFFFTPFMLRLQKMFNFSFVRMARAYKVHLHPNELSSKLVENIFESVEITESEILEKIVSEEYEFTAEIENINSFLNIEPKLKPAKTLDLSLLIFLLKHDGLMVISF